LAATARPAFTLVLTIFVLASKLAVGLAAGELERIDFFSIAMCGFSWEGLDLFNALLDCIQWAKLEPAGKTFSIAKKSGHLGKQWIS
jgi:hypothetical protein